MGDFNTDLSGPGSNFTNLTSFMSSHNLVCVDKLYNINYTYRKDDFSCFSSPDHILTYSNFTNLIDSVFTLDPAENFSDHHFSLTFSDFLFLVLIIPLLIVIVTLITLMLNPLHLLTGSKSIHIIFLLIVITFLPSFLNFLMTSFIVVILTAPLTISILTATVCNFLTVLSLLQTFVSPQRVTVYDMVLSLVGIDLHIPLSNLLSFGTKFGLIVVVQPLESCSRLRRTAKGDLSMRFVGSTVVKITFNVKTLQQLSHIVVHKSSGYKLRNFQSPPAVPCPHLVLLMVVTMILKYLIFLRLSSSHFSTLTLIYNPKPINTVLRNLLTPLPSLLFLSPRRPFVMLSLNLNTARMMAQSSPPITSSMLKMFSVFLFLSCSLQ